MEDELKHPQKESIGYRPLVGGDHSQLLYFYEPKTDSLAMLWPATAPRPADNAANESEPRRKQNALTT